MNRIIVWTVLLGIMILFTGCGGQEAEEEAANKIAEKAIEKQSGGEVKANISKDKIEISNKEGNYTISESGDAKIVDGFPADVYVPKNVKIVMSGKQDQSYILMLETTAASEGIIEEYKKNFKEKEWTEKTVMNMEEAVMLQYEKDERTAVVTITKEDDKTQIQIVANEKKTE